jgi:hypothetical protein
MGAETRFIKKQFFGEFKHLVKSTDNPGQYEQERNKKKKET